MMKLPLISGLLSLAPFGACGALLAPSMSPPGGRIHSPALVTLTNHNSQGDLLYTLDGSDPRDPFGGVSSRARVMDAAVSVNRSLVIRARVKSGAEWSEPAAAAFTADQDLSNLIFTELMYHPRTGTNNGSEFEEFIEWKNVGRVPLDLSGLELRYNFSDQALMGLPVFKCPPGTIVPPGEFYVLARRTNVFHSNYPGVPVAGELATFLSNSEGSPELRSSDGAIASIMAWHSHAPWPVVPDNHGYFGADPEVGFSLVRVTLDPSADSTHFSTWRASTFRYGSPGADDPDPIVPPILINEVLIRSAGAWVDTVELFNPNPTNVHLGGWWLSDERNAPFDYMIPIGTMIPAHGYLVLDELDFNTGTNSLSFDADGERCYLFSGDTNGRLTGYDHGYQFLGSDPNVSFGRNRLSDGSDVFLPEAALSFGAANAGPWLPPLLITEILYDPDTPEESFIELRNTTDAPLPLWDLQRPNQTWNIGGRNLSAGYYLLHELPANIVVPPSGQVLLVHGDPEAFRTAHDVPVSVVILPFNFSLPFASSNDGLNIIRPAGDSPADSRPRLQVVDEVTFRGVWPWSPFVSAGGQSLERIGLSPLGSEASNWRLSPTGRSPGRNNSGNVAPRVLAGGDRFAFTGRVTTLTGMVLDDGWPGTTTTSWWTQVSGPDAVSLAAAAESATVTFTQTGQYTFRFHASDGLLAHSDETVLQVIPPPYEGWRQANFNGAEVTDDSVSGPTADPDLDGLINAEEYFFARSPNIPDAERPLRAALVSRQFEAAWTQNADAVDVIPRVQRSDRIEGPWFGGSGLFAIEETPGPQSTSIKVTARSLLPLTAGEQQFIRLQLSW